MEKLISEKKLHANLEKKLVNELTELISKHEFLGMSYKEDDVTIINPKYISQQEKDSIYHLWAFLKTRNYLTDKKLKGLVENNPDKFERYKVIVKNFPNLVEELKKNGLDNTLLLCAKQRRMVKQLREKIDIELSAAKKNSPAKILAKKQLERAYFKALYIYVKKINMQLTDAEFNSLVESFPRQLGVYSHMLKEVPNLIEALKDDGYSYVIGNLLKIDDPNEYTALMI